MSSTDSFMGSEIIFQMMLGLKYDNLAMKFIPKRLSDDELSRIKVPVLLLVGERENVNRGNPELVIKRAERLIDNIQTAVLPGAVHMLNAEEPDLVNSMINRFLSSE
jgi:pimeloyl-ACP methyl ester carboxylesterase